MPILEKIKETEMKAEELKNKAREQVQILLKDNEKQIDKNVQEMMDSAKAQIETMNAQTKDDLVKLEKSLVNETSIKCANDTKHAKEVINETVDYIIRKVIAS